MARDAAAFVRPASFAVHPWVLILTGLALAIAGYLLGATVPNGTTVLRVGLALVGVTVAIVGVRVRLRQARWELQERIESAAMIAVTSATAAAAYFGMQSNWESGKMLFAAVLVLSLAGSALVLLPTLGRKIFLSFFLLFHFGGMLTAVTSVDPPNSTGPWLSKQSWTYVYRPYLSFLYLTNAYHFYSPDPGPPALMWYSVQYEDGSRTWIRLPERATSPVSMHYQRLLALSEHSYTPNARLPFSKAELDLMRAEARRENRPFEMPARGSWEDIVARRERIGSTQSYPAEFVLDGKKEVKALTIPMIWGMADYLQYREPHDTSKKLIASLGKHVALTAPRKINDSGESVGVKSVKAYRIVHNIITPQELAKDGDPMDKARHWAYFLGEFDAKGEMVSPKDPFLYWYVPMQYVPKEFVDRVQMQPKQVVFGLAPGKDKDGKDTTVLLDCLEMHAAGTLDK